MVNSFNCYGYQFDYVYFCTNQIMENQIPAILSSKKIIREAFGYWKKTILFQAMFSLLFFSILFMVSYYFSSHYGILDQYESAADKLKDGVPAYMKEVQRIAATPEYRNLSWAMLLTLVFLYPLNIGFYKIYRKMDLNEKPVTGDLFAGYVGMNFFIYTSYFLFWMMIFSYTVPTLFLAVAWVFATLFAAPLMFFMDKRIFEIFGLNWQALKKYPGAIIVCALVALLVKYAGLMTIIGAVFTFPFWNAMIYALYRNIFSEIEKK